LPCNLLPSAGGWNLLQMLWLMRIWPLSFKEIWMRSIEKRMRILSNSIRQKKEFQIRINWFWMAFFPFFSIKVENVKKISRLIQFLHRFLIIFSAKTLTEWSKWIWRRNKFCFFSVWPTCCTV
jgi:hypothetical protein